MILTIGFRSVNRCLYRFPAVETLMRKHEEFRKLLESQVHRVEELEKLASVVLQRGHDHIQVEKRVQDVLLRTTKLKVSIWKNKQT